MCVSCGQMRAFRQPHYHQPPGFPPAGVMTALTPKLLDRPPAVLQERERERKHTDVNTASHGKDRFLQARDRLHYSQQQGLTCLPPESIRSSVRTVSCLKCSVGDDVKDLSVRPLTMFTRTSPPCGEVMSPPRLVTCHRRCARLRSNRRTGYTTLLGPRKLPIQLSQANNRLNETVRRVRMQSTRPLCVIKQRQTLAQGMPRGRTNSS